MEGAVGSNQPRWDEPTQADVQCVREQLQRHVKDILGVVVRCRYGRPQVVANRPLLWDGKAVDALPDEELDPKRVGVFPTLFWLTCPHLNRAIGRLESRGWVDRVKQEIAGDPAERQELEAAHRETAAIRRQLVSETTLQRLKDTLPGHYRVLVASGVGGIQPTHQAMSSDDTEIAFDALGVKCLHAHFADYLARGKNPVGRRVWGLLTAGGVDPRGQGTCFTGNACRCPGAATAESERAPEALIDIGSNSVRLLIGRAEADGEIAVFDRALVTTRLGSGVSERGELEPQAVEETLDALKTFRQRAAELGANESKAWGTAALREARNREAFLVRAWEEARVAVRVMSAEEEAILSFRGALGVFRELADNQTVLLADIGGGSTDIVLGSGAGSVVWTQSLPMGAVRLARELGNAADTTDWQTIGRKVRAALEAGLSRMPKRLDWAAFGLNNSAANLIAVGGTATSLAAIDLGLQSYDPARVNGHMVSLPRLRHWLEELAALDASTRATIPGMPPQRADIIVPGLIILHELLQWVAENEIGQPSCYISDCDLLQGALAQQ